MRIVDVKCCQLGVTPVVRVVSDEGISGYGQGSNQKPLLRAQIAELKQALLGMDPTQVERCMLTIRRRGGVKPWGGAVSVIEHALWDLAGKAAGLPVHRLLGGKVRDAVRVYNGGVRKPMQEATPAHFRDIGQQMRELEHGFTIVKQSIAFHGQMKHLLHDFTYGAITPKGVAGLGPGDRGPLTPSGMRTIIACVEALREGLGPDIGLALDCGPGWTKTDAIRFARETEPLGLMWLEDMIAGNYSPSADAHIYRELTQATVTPIHTGEQIYLRQNFRELIDTQAVDVIGPDPADVGGIAELKWIAEHADLYGIQVAPHGYSNGVLGLAALVQVASTLPDNFIAFEYPVGMEDWWYDIIDGLPSPIVRNGLIEVPDRPGMGFDLLPAAARRFLSEGDEGFFD